MNKLLVFAISITALLTSPLQAQEHRRNEPRDRHVALPDGNTRISDVVRDTDQRATEFRQALDRALDHSRLNGSRKEDRLNSEAKRLDQAISRLRESWNREHDVERSRQHVASAIKSARWINEALEKHEIHGRVQREWETLRSELNLLAEAFHEPKIHWGR